MYPAPASASLAVSPPLGCAGEVPRGTGPREVAAAPVCVILKTELSITLCEITPII